MAALGTPDGIVGIIGGPDVFGMFLDRYDVFHLSRAPDVRLPGGRPVFPEVPTRTPEEVLASHGLASGQRQVLDPAERPGGRWLATFVKARLIDEPQFEFLTPVILS